MKFLEAVSTEDQRVILDLESDIIDLKQRMLDADSDEKESLKQLIVNIKQEITDIKDAAQED
jgi:hypothetical protein